MDVFEEFGSVEELVRLLLASDERCRRDDKWLVYRVLRHYSPVYIRYEDFVKFPSFETISRVRRKVQNVDGLFLPDGKTAEKRLERECDVRKWSRS